MEKRVQVAVEGISPSAVLGVLMYAGHCCPPGHSVGVAIGHDDNCPQGDKEGQPVVTSEDGLKAELEGCTCEGVLLIMTFIDAVVPAPFSEN